MRFELHHLAVEKGAIKIDQRLIRLSRLPTR